MRPHIEAMFEGAEAQDFRTLERANLRIGAMCTIGPTRLIGFFKSSRARVPQAMLNLHDAPAPGSPKCCWRGDLGAVLIALPNYPERFETPAALRRALCLRLPPRPPLRGDGRGAAQGTQHRGLPHRVDCEYPEYFAALGIPNPAADFRVCHETEREGWIQTMIPRRARLLRHPRIPADDPRHRHPAAGETRGSYRVVLDPVGSRRHSPATPDVHRPRPPPRV